jgi:hypothetical protein
MLERFPRQTWRNRTANGPEMASWDQVAMTETSPFGAPASTDVELSGYSRSAILTSFCTLLSIAVWFEDLRAGAKFPPVALTSIELQDT